MIKNLAHSVINYKSNIKISTNTKILCTGTIAVGLSVCSTIRTIQPGYIGYSNLFGNISDEKYSPGIHFVNPFTSMIKISLMKKNLTLDVSVASSEGLTIIIQLNALYNIDINQSKNIFINYRDFYEYLLIKPHIQSVLRNIISSYEAKALYSDKSRDEIKNKINNEIKNKLYENGILINDILINNIQLPVQLVNAIELKLKTEQENEQMYFTIEKERQKINFSLEKEQREAERKKIEAEGIKIFQDIVSKGISKELLVWKSISATEQLATSNNSKIIVIGGKDGLPVILNS